MTMRRLIVNADDFGLHPAVNEAVRQAAAQGVLTSVSILAGGEHAHEAIALQRDFPRLSLGVHLALVEAPPVLDASRLPTLAPGGRFDGRFARFSARLLTGRVQTHEIERELDAQIARLRSWGLLLSHADGHQHLHVLPGVMRHVLRVLRRHDIRRLRLPLEPRCPRLPKASLARESSMSMLRLLASRARAPLAGAGLATPRGCLGVTHSGHLTLARVVPQLLHTGAGTWELVTHPCTDARALAEHYGWGFDGEGELAMLCADSMRAALTRAGWSLVSYRELPTPSARL